VTTPRNAVLLASDADGRQIVSLHVKKSYAFDERGTCRVADEQAPLFMPRAELLAPWHTEMDVLPFKRSTDIIVHALAYGGGARTCLASIAVAGRKLVYQVAGDRRCGYRGAGSTRFSEPEPFDTIPICYENAYGGVDETVEAPTPTTLAECFRRHPGEYPRNTVGRGYVVTERRDVLDGLLLPNVEHPEQPLSPENIVVGAPDLWWRQPLPWSCDWFAKSWYPRSSFLGGPPPDMPLDDRDVAEVRLGWVEAGQRARAERMTAEEMGDGRHFDAASPALVLPFLRANERIELTSMTRGGRLVVELPGERPRMAVRFEGQTHELTPVPNRLLISVEEERLSIVWHGAWQTPRELPDRFPEEGDDETMELEGVEAFIDGVMVTPGGEV
jgi:hypothetical protein